ncbi:RraA family protein [Thalassococcus profundi]|uniref:Putative 4-hydroxy-4-methyl-2-oxoglutarate aldolase n=1 Tax=Thalassococcus profundi TaxID=2282382 RepID=A0A369TKV7_9RHOB|nr:RraA family protein [Thalassococcus profundi]RDD65860.1 RraA family protein [Thalassococcus profundi]
MTIGFSIRTRSRKVAAALVERFAKLPVANISDSMSRMSAAGPRLRPYHAQGTVLAGPALTVRTRPGDNLLVHKAIDMAEAGDVIVVDAGGDLTNSIMGEIMVYLAQEKGVAGFVIDGAIRDADEIRESGIGMFAAGVTHRGPYKDGPGEINAPVSIDAMVIHPGDLIVGDCDGLVCVPLDAAAAILDAAEAKQRAEVTEIAAIRDGNVDRSWVDKLLETRGVAYID